MERRIVIEKEPPTEEFPEGRESETVIEPNTNEKAVVRVLVQTKKVPQSELVEDKPSPRRSPDPTADRKTPEDKTPDDKSDDDDEKKKSPEKPVGEEEKKEDVLVDVEEDQNDMALAVPNRVSLAPAYSVYVMHQYAQRMHR